MRKERRGGTLCQGDGEAEQTIPYTTREKNTHARARVMSLVGTIDAPLTGVVRHAADEAGITNHRRVRRAPTRLTAGTPTTRT